MCNEPCDAPMHPMSINICRHLKRKDKTSSVQNDIFFKLKFKMQFENQLPFTSIVIFGYANFVSNLDLKFGDIIEKLDLSRNSNGSRQNQPHHNSMHHICSKMVEENIVHLQLSFSSNKVNSHKRRMGPPFVVTTQNYTTPRCYL